MTNAFGRASFHYIHNGLPIRFLINTYGLRQLLEGVADQLRHPVPVGPRCVQRVFVTYIRKHDHHRATRERLVDLPSVQPLHPRSMALRMAPINRRLAWVRGL